MVPTKEEFINAFTANKFPVPRDCQYIGFVNGIDAETFSSKREVAMFLANLMQESGGLTIKIEQRCLKNGCKGDYTLKTDLKDKHYFGGCYLQCTWSCNYKKASACLFGDSNILHQKPEIVAENEDLA